MDSRASGRRRVEPEPHGCNLQQGPRGGTGSETEKLNVDVAQISEVVDLRIQIRFPFDTSEAAQLIC